MRLSIRRDKFLGPLLVAISGVVMLAWSWGTWPDPIVDFGRELYVPWQLSEGKVLYRDIVSYFNGPLSPYVHALLFKCLGASLRTLVLFNIAVIIAIVTMLYRLLLRADAGHLVAAVAGVAFFVLFAFAQFLNTGNYNYVCPYSYELPHGIALTLGALTCLLNWREQLECGRPVVSRRWLLACGALLGLVFLTKAEVFLAAVAAIGAGVLATSWVNRNSPRQLLRTFGVLVGAALAPVVIALGSLCTRMSVHQAIAGLLGAWRWIGEARLLSMPYFKQIAGTADVEASIKTIAISAGAYVAIFGVPLILGVLARRRPGARAMSAAIFPIWLIAGLAFWTRVNWSELIRPMPLLLTGVIAAVGWSLVKHRRGSIAIFVLCVWALAMLAKTPLRAHIDHYGFALGMPATIVGIALLAGWIPKWLESRNRGSGWPLRAATCAALIAACVAHGYLLDYNWSRKTTTLGSGADAFLAPPYADIVNAAISELNADSPDRRATLAVLPEGLMINYLARRTNPTGQLNFTPPAVVMYGEDAMTRAFQSHPPDFVMIVGVDTVEYGARFFGIDYAQQLGGWIKENYEQVKTLGAVPFKEPGFGITLMKRKPAFQDDRIGEQ